MIEIHIYIVKSRMGVILSSSLHVKLKYKSEEWPKAYNDRGIYIYIC